MLKALQALHPGNFALVMATGILSIGLQSHAQYWLSTVFSIIAVAAWVILIFLCTVRVVLFPGNVWADLTTSRTVFSYFTLVAATNIVGMLMLTYDLPLLATACWFLAFIFWSLLLYLAFSVLTFISHEHNVNIVHGGWLITIVGTQSLVLLGVKIAPFLGHYANYMMMEVHLLWGLGLALYGIFIVLFCHRIFFLELKPEDLSPLLWVVMGAAAISANAGTSLFESENQLSFLANQKPFIDGVTLMTWSWATWLIPLLTLFGVWKHLVRKIPFRYEPIVWSIVFPLGMYAVASDRLGVLAEFPPMVWISQVMLCAGLVAWASASSGLLRRLGQTIFSGEHEHIPK